MKIFLIGLPGSGKSTLGKKLSNVLGRTFVDLDNEITVGEGLSIESLFATVGEKQFRIIERDYLLKYCGESTDFVMATGGGTPCFLSNMELINKCGISVFIDTSVQTIAKRLIHTELSKRPLFAGHDAHTLEAKIVQMRSERIAFYEQAQIKITAIEISPEEIAKQFLDLERNA